MCGCVTDLLGAVQYSIAVAKLIDRCCVSEWARRGYNDMPCFCLCLYIRANGGSGPYILNVSVGLWPASLFHLLYPQGRSTLYSLNVRRGGPQFLFGRFEKRSTLYSLNVRRGGPQFLFERFEKRSTRYSLNRRLGGSQSLFGRFEKIKVFLVKNRTSTCRLYSPLVCNA